MKTLYFGIAVVVLCELGQLALVCWADNYAVVETADLRRVAP